jgi:glycine/D-amino acid oxidase-like deaminating enzyme
MIGQTCLVANECNATVTRQNADGSWTFCVPRNFHGGTKEPDNWDPEPSSEVRKILLDKFAATHPAIVDHGGPENFRVLRDIVGRRPTRKGGLRLEAEQVSIPGKKDSRVVVHAYGLGGRGFELSWGVAERVLQLVEEQLSDSDRTYKYPPPSRL